MCPDNFKGENDKKLPQNGFIQTHQNSYDHVVIFNDYYTKIPEFPSKGYIDVTVTLTPKKITMLGGNQNACTDRNYDMQFSPKNARISNPSFIRDTD